MLIKGVVVGVRHGASSCYMSASNTCLLSFDF